MSHLIDTTEMYLRTVYELVEEGIAPLRARIAERLHQSGPTVSQTVARMERDGLLVVRGDRTIELTASGRDLATRVMRKHRLAECLLTEVIGLDFDAAHEEACRWEHVISDEAERRLVAILSNPGVSPYGNPIPALDDHGSLLESPPAAPLNLRGALAATGEATVTITRISEFVQADRPLLEVLASVGLRPGAQVAASFDDGRLCLRLPDADPADSCFVEDAVADHLFVSQ